MILVLTGLSLKAFSALTVKEICMIRSSRKEILKRHQLVRTKQDITVFITTLKATNTWTQSVLTPTSAHALKTLNSLLLIFKSICKSLKMAYLVCRETIQCSSSKMVIILLGLC